MADTIWSLNPTQESLPNPIRPATSPNLAKLTTNLAKSTICVEVRQSGTVVKPIPLDQLEARFGTRFATALRQRLHLDASDTVEAWNVGQAKDHFSEVLDRVRDGECQLVRRRSEEPVLMMSITQLAKFVELAAPKRRFADIIGHGPTLPVGDPLTVSEAGTGRDEIEI